MNSTTSKSLKALREEDFVRQRWNPAPGDEHYLALSDLRLALNKISTKDNIRILDYGAGGSPYQKLFPCAEYIRVDFEGDMDHLLMADGTVPIQSGTFDLILSTQVLEHCLAPENYVRECERLLKVGGQLVLSTHGLFEEHACPHDYQRWTQAGLENLMKCNGFEIVRSYRLTAGPRGGVFLFDRSMRGVKCVDASLLWNLVWRTFRRAWFRLQPLRDKLTDLLFANLRVVDDSSLRGAHTYVGLVVVARKA